MAVPSSLTSPSAPHLLLPPELAGARGERGRDSAVRPVAPATAVRSALQRPADESTPHQPRPHPRPAEEDRRPDAERTGAYRLAARPNSKAPRGRQSDGQNGGYAGLRGLDAERLAPHPGASTPFLVQLLGQEPDRAQVLIPQHRDAAVRGSDAYRRTGATPPIYSEQPTLFSFAI